MKPTTDTGEAAKLADPDSAALITNSGSGQHEWLDMLNRMSANNDYWRARYTEAQRKWIDAETSLANWKFAFVLLLGWFALVAAGFIITLIR